jgi:hypothetical protein
MRWLYWYFWVVVVAIEAIAGAVILADWLPLPAWLIRSALLALMTGCIGRDGDVLSCGIGMGVGGTLIISDFAGMTSEGCE